MECEEEWGGDAYSDRSLAALPAEEVQAFIARLQSLKTVTNQDQNVMQTPHKDLPEASEVQWEEVARGQVPFPDGIPGGEKPPPTVAAINLAAKKYPAGTASMQAAPPPPTGAHTKFLAAGGQGSSGNQIIPEIYKAKVEITRDDP